MGEAASAAIAGLTLLLALWPGFALIVALATESANSACVLNAGRLKRQWLQSVLCVSESRPQQQQRPDTVRANRSATKRRTLPPYTKIAETKSVKSRLAIVGCS